MQLRSFFFGFHVRFMVLHRRPPHSMWKSGRLKGIWFAISVVNPKCSISEFVNITCEQRRLVESSCFGQDFDIVPCDMHLFDLFRNRKLCITVSDSNIWIWRHASLPLLSVPFLFYRKKILKVSGDASSHSYTCQSVIHANFRTKTLNMKLLYA